MRDPGLSARTPRRKRFGQHFLHDPAVIERIVEAIRPTAGERLVEIGPGRGALTRRLLESGAGSLDAIEIDRDLGGLLRAQLGPQDNPGKSRVTNQTMGTVDQDARFPGGPRAGFVLHEVDALEFDFAALARERGGRLRVVGNLPYNISTPLLFHLLRSGGAITDLHIMLQREVIARMAARAGDPDYGRLSVMLAPWATVERLFDVGPGAFQPPPRVWSAVARVTLRAEPAFPLNEHFGTVVAAAFAHRRKTLRNALRGLIGPEQIEAAGLDPGARPETFSAEAFNAIAQKIVRSQPGP